MRPALDQFRDALRRGEQPIAMLVPTATMAEHTRHTLAREGFVLQPHWIDTLAGFSRRWTRGWREASPSALLLLVDQAIEKLRPPELARVQGLPGVAAAMARAIEEVSTAGCRPEHLPGALGAIFKHVDNALRERKLLLRADLLRLAASNVRAHGTIWLDGFLAFSDPELEFLNALRRYAKVAIGERVDAPRQVEAFHAPSIDLEAQAIAVRILESGIEFRDIAVAARNTGQYEQPLVSACARYGIPLRVLDAKTMLKTSFFRVNDAFVHSFSHGWDQETLLSALRDAGFTSLIDRWDFQVRARIPARGIDDLPEPLKSRLETLEIPPSLAPAEWPDRFKAIWKALEINDIGLRPVLEEAAGFLGEAPLSLAQFWRKAAPAVRAAAAPDRDRRRNVVHFLSVYEARQWNPQLLFLCGLSDDLFPRPWPSTPFLPDSVRKTLKNAGFRVRLREEWDAEERALFDSLRSHRFVMSYAGDRASEFLAGIAVEESKSLPFPAPVARPVLIRPPASFQQSTVSASGLELYQECPFQYFASRVLRLAERPPRPADRLDFRLRGTIVHDALAKGGDFNEVFENHCVTAAVPEGYKKEYFRLEMSEDLRAFERAAKFETPLRTIAEQQFQVLLAQGVVLRGRIDRIDIGADGRATVIDYKYSRSDRVRRIFKDPNGLQGPLYVLAAQKQWSLDVARMVFCGLRRDPVILGWESPGPEWVERARAQAEELAYRIQNAAFKPRPSDPSICQRCDYRDVCRFQAQKAAEAGE